MESLNIKQSAHELIDSLPPDATWKDILYEIYIRQEIELGLEDSRNGSVESVEDIRKEYGLKP
jgi:hypothetical protein